MEENICNRCVKQSVCKNYIKGQNVVGCIEFLSIKRTDYLTDDELLDKIRAEIEQEYNRLSVVRADETLELGECLGLKMSLKIIDKYKTKARNE